MELDSLDERHVVLESDEDEGETRSEWNNKLQSGLTMVGFMVGVGNLWRFPYLCLKNGGGAFLIPFVLCGIFLAFPLFLLELSLGQFTGKALHKCWEACPLLKGIGYGMLTVEGIYLYYIMIMTWTMYYLGNSFISPLPWTQYGKWWNTGACEYCSDVTNSTSNATEEHSLKNISKLYTKTEEFFEKKVVQLSAGIEDFGSLNLPILLCLAGSWLIVFLCTMKGVKSIGKVVYVTATLPYVLLVVLLIRSLMNPGAIDGVKFLVIPDLEKLKDVNVWIEAALQIIYSTCVGIGPLITIQGFNKFKNNCVRDAAITFMIGEGSSVLSGLLVCSVLGYMAHEKGQTIQETAKSGPGLAYVVYPEAVSKLPLPNLWAVLFFLMLFTLVLDTTFGIYEPIITAVCDSFKTVRRHRVKTVAIICMIFLIMSIPFTYQNGFYLFQLIDWYIVSFCFPLFGFIECLIFGWIYGADQFCKDIELMAGRSVPVFVRICWCFITPLILMMLFVAVIVMYEPPSYGEYKYPTAATTCGLVLSILPLVPIPIVALQEIRKADGDTFVQKLKSAAKPSIHWKPNSTDCCEEYRHNNVDSNSNSIFTSVKRNLLGR